ncbi:MAG: hypothetical protein IKD33_04765 [Bacteroidales bacterium]|nr:hypothetical protein [Bacteroidales bacterium]
MRRPPLSNNGNHPFRTTATTFSEQRQPPFSNNGNTLSECGPKRIENKDVDKKRKEHGVWENTK